MKINMLYESDADLKLIQSKKVAVIGYGNQGHAHALNLRDSAVEIRIGLNPGSKSQASAIAQGLKVVTILEASEWADVIMLLVPDESAARVFRDSIAPKLRPGQTLAVAHGFNIHFGKITAPSGISVIMISPKGPGRALRQQYLDGSGLPGLIAVAQDSDGIAKKLALSYAKAIGLTRVGVMETTFREETETDLFGEQTVLCGGVSGLIRAGFEVLVEAGYSPAMAYFECLYEVKLITDLIHEHGIAKMREAISNTAEYGDYRTSARIISPEVKEQMREVLRDIQSGRFADEWLREMNELGGRNFLEMRRKAADHPIEEIGELLRASLKKGNFRPAAQR